MPAHAYLGSTTLIALLTLHCGSDARTLNGSSQDAGEQRGAMDAPVASNETGGGADGSDDVGRPDGADCTAVRLPPTGTQAPGTWMDVTPPNADFATTNGAGTALVDPVRPGDIYVGTDKRGMFKSTDYGMTWKKVNTGANGDKLDGTTLWSTAIDRNPCRDPSTSPTVYVGGLFGGGLWKSVDGGVDWTSVWDKNIYAEDGVTNISSDVGNDVGNVVVVDPAGRDHLIVVMHSYFGTLGNVGFYETTDGGGKWILHKSSQFSFQPHNDLFCAIDEKIWLVTPGTISSRLNYYRTTNGGLTWTDLGNAPVRSLCYAPVFAGNAIYTGTDYNDGVWKSLDKGQTWQQVGGMGGHVSWVLTTATQVYGSDGYGSMMPSIIRHSQLANDGAWLTEKTPSGMTDNGHKAAVTSDGAHYILVAPSHKVGIWRYVEP
jgi:hypothetical protein